MRRVDRKGDVSPSKCRCARPTLDRGWTGCANLGVRGEGQTGRGSRCPTGGRLGFRHCDPEWGRRPAPEEHHGESNDHQARAENRDQFVEGPRARTGRVSAADEGLRRPEAGNEDPHKHEAHSPKTERVSGKGGLRDHDPLRHENGESTDRPSRWRLQGRSMQRRSRALRRQRPASLFTGL